jgi:GT2 family glycosyltransferase
VWVVQLPENIGFGPAYNAAVPKAHGDFIVFLNNDTIVHEHWLNPLLDQLLSDDHVGITTSKVLFMGTRILNAAGGQLKLWQGGFELGFGRDESFLSDIPIVEPFFASGSAMAMSARLFAKLSGFDPDIRMYAEDLDISWRARLAGLTIRYVADSEVLHHYSGTAGVFNTKKHRQVITNTMAVMIKSLSLPNLCHSIPAFTVFSVAKGAGLAIIQRNPRYFWNVFLSVFDITAKLPRLASQRRETQRFRVVPDKQLFRSQGFGLIGSPLELLRVLRRANQLTQTTQLFGSSQSATSSTPQKGPAVPGDGPRVN